MTLPADLGLRVPAPGDERAIADMIAACDETYRAWTQPGWEPPPPGRELDRWRGRITDGSCWTRMAVEPGGRVVALVCFAQAVVHPVLPGTGGLPVRARPSGEDRLALEPIPHRAHVSAVFTHPDRWREGIATAMLAIAEDAMRAQGYREVQLWTPREAPARRFYDANGWRHDGREQWLEELALAIVAYVKPL